MDSATSKKTALKLTAVARASLQELLLDFEDFLRLRGLRLCSKDSPEALTMRQRLRSDKSNWPDWSKDPEAAANAPICLIYQATYLLRRQLEGLE